MRQKRKTDTKQQGPQKANKRKSVKSTHYKEVN